MKFGCHVAALIVLLSLNGCILDLFFGHKKKDPGIRPIGADRAAVAPTNQMSDFDKVKDPKINADTWFASGQLQESQGHIPAAIENYKNALKVNDEHHGALYRLGVLYATSQKYPEAIATWKKYINVTHHSAVGYSNLGFSYELSGAYADAERAYLTGIERDSDSAPCRINYGLMLARHGRIADGVAQMQMVLSEAEVHFNVGSVHEGQGRRELAREEYQKALQLNPKLTDAKLRLQKLDATAAVNPQE
jgi:tetratricopeptide (TPR) repeat protein